MTAGPRHPWRMLMPLGAVVALAALWTIYWTVASTMIQNAYGDAERKLAAEGTKLECDQARWAGFPFRIERWCHSPKLSLSKGPIAVSASNLILAVQAYNPRHAIALIDGPTEITGPLGLTVNHERALASLKFSSEDNWQASIELPKLTVEGKGSSDRLLLHARMTGTDVADAALAAEKADIKLANGSDLALDAVDLSATFPKEALGENLLKALAQSGKTVSITAASVRQGELTITGSGTVGIDHDGYLTGDIATRVNRIDLLFAVVKRLAHLKDDDVEPARVIVTLLSQNTPGETSLDLTVRDHKLYWGPFKIAKLKPLF